MRFLKNVSLILLAAVSLFSACQKEEYSLGALPDKSQVQFEVIQDLSVDPGGNTVILVNKTPGTVAMWDYVTGKSSRDRDTVRYAFQGDYNIKFSVMTAGGIVEATPKLIKVTQNELKYVNDPVWKLLTGGGPGFEKTWVLDVNANGDKKVFTSPIYFAGTQIAYGTQMPSGEVEWTKVEPSPGCNCWTYNPTYTSDTWAAEKKDHGSMTFSLKGGAVFTANHAGIGGLGAETGTFMVDAANLKITTSGASPLGVSYTHTDMASIYEWKIISLNENTMQLAGKHKSKDEVQVLNFLSKSFSDAWVAPPPAVPASDPGFNPKFAADGLVNFITGGFSRVWKLDGTGNPVDWLAKGKGWTKVPGDSYNWGWNDNWAAISTSPTSWIKFEKSGMKYTKSQEGVISTGTFSVNQATNEITLSGSNTLIQNGDHWMSPKTQVLKVVKAFPDDISKGIWFGTSYDGTKDEWFAFHYVLF